MNVSYVGFIYVIILRVERSILLLFQVDNLMNNFGGGCQAILNHRRQPMGYCQLFMTSETTSAYSIPTLSQPYSRQLAITSELRPIAGLGSLDKVR